eukprot:2746304-Rhodomonas_salina.2
MATGQGECVCKAEKTAHGQVGSAICLRACCAMSSTVIADAAVGLCKCYAMSGTVRAYGCVSMQVLCDVRYCHSIWLRVYASAMRCPCYAMSGTVPHSGCRMVCPVLTQRMGSRGKNLSSGLIEGYR